MGEEARDGVVQGIRVLLLIDLVPIQDCIGLPPIGCRVLSLFHLFDLCIARRVRSLTKARVSRSLLWNLSKDFIQ